MATFVPRFLRQLRDVVITSPSDGEVLAYDDGTGKWVNSASGGGGGAPTDATYITQTANGSLSAEQALGSLATGLVKNTTTTGVLSIATANTDYAAAAHASRHEDGGADEISLAGLSGTPADLQTHLDDTSDAHDASAISILDTANDFTATDVEGALAELQSDAESDAQALTDHISDSSAAHAASAISADSTTLVGTGTDVQAVLEELDNGIADHLADSSAAHAASAISFSATGSIASTDAQAAIAEVATDAASALTTHESDTTSVHGITDTSTLYRSGGTDVALADGGTGASLADPNADRILFWDDSAGAMTWLTPGTGLTITTTTIDASGGSSVTGEEETIVIAGQLFG